jgi:signal transduction histidine kinase
MAAQHSPHDMTAAHDGSTSAAELAALGQFLHERQAALLEAWRALLRGDPAMTSSRVLTGPEINDHMPMLLALYGRRLAGMAEAYDGQAVPHGGEAHGLHRWQQGYDLREVSNELGRLNECMVAELEAYAAARPQLSAGVMAEARRRWAALLTEASCASTAQFHRLQQLEAAGHIDELDGALDDLLELERMRAELWQQAAHDLRGNVAVVANATAGLASGGLPGSARESFLKLLQRNVSALNHLLNDITSLARLQAGEEHRQVSPFDAALLLRELCLAMAGLAEQRGLSLAFHGPERLPVEGDAVKLRRIVQNLILNALAYTRQGGVQLRCEGPHAGDDQRWLLTLHDTGPGLQTRSEAPIAAALEQATALKQDAAATQDAAAPAAAPAVARPHASRTPGGEGLGLSIVKRLCDLLDATVEVESLPGQGTTFRIRFPLGYGSA